MARTRSADAPTQAPRTAPRAAPRRERERASGAPPRRSARLAAVATRAPEGETPGRARRPRARRTVDEEEDDEEEEEAAPRDLGGRRERALQQRLYLLDRPTPPEFDVMGATGNLYRVTLEEQPRCTCMDFRFRGRTARCKHILFVLLRVLGLRPDDSAAGTAPRRLPADTLAALLAAPARRAAAAAPYVAERFAALSRGEAVPEVPVRPIDADNDVCAVCYEELALPEEEAAPLVHCRLGCGRSVHAACFAHWAAARRRAREPVTCVYCRALWEPPPRRKLPRGQYLNLLDAMGGGGSSKRARREGG